MVDRTVLHVLPHPGGGGETYVDSLVEMDGYSFERVYLAADANPAGAHASIVRRAVRVQRAAMKYDVLHIVGEVASLLCLPALGVTASVVSPSGLSLLRRSTGARKTAAEVALRSVVRAASRTVCCSEDEFAVVRGVVGERSRRRLVVVRNGVELADPVTTSEKAAARAQLGLDSSEVVGAWVGTLQDLKDPLTPIRAAQEVRAGGDPLVLLIAGDGPLRPDVELAAREGDRDAVRVLGFQSNVRQVLAAADFFVLSSQREGLSFSLLEALALGLRAVVSNAPANVEAVGDTGIVVRFGVTSDFVDAFRRVLSEPQRLALSEAARARVALHFDREKMVCATREVYEALTA